MKIHPTTWRILYFYRIGEFAKKKKIVFRIGVSNGKNETEIKNQLCYIMFDYILRRST